MLAGSQFERPSRVPAALRHGPFVRLWGGSILSSVGTQMNNVAKVWLLYELTGSAAALGLEGLCFSVPIAVLPLFAGPLVDRFDRVRVVKVGLCLETSEAVVLAALSGTVGLTPWMIYLAAAVAAARLSFVIPAGTALVPALVPPRAVLSAMSLSAVVWSSSALVGPAVGGLLLARTGASAVFVLNAVATIVALIALRPVTRSTLLTVQPCLPTTHVTEGLRFLMRRRHVLALQGLILISSTLLIGTETLLPVLDVQIWDGGTLGYGLLRAAPGVAAVVAGLLLSLTRPFRRLFLANGIGSSAATVGLVAFVQMPSLAGGFVVLAVATMALVGTQILTATAITHDTPDEYRGAVGGVTAIGQSGLAGIAAAGMAVAATGIGAPATLVVVAAIAAPLALTATVAAYRLRSRVKLSTLC